MIGALEVVKNKSTRDMFPTDVNVMGILGANARKNGLILRLVGNRIAFSPPQIISETEVGEMIGRLTRALDDTWSAIGQN